ncbi:hypothetical protein JCM8097_002376 [Rhodosporidiobolus ruineniae]
MLASLALLVALVGLVQASSIDVNPSTANIALTDQGSEWLWTCFALFLFSALILAFIAHKRPKGHRSFHHPALAVLLITTVTYFQLASNLGWTPIAVEWVRAGTRGQQQLRNGAIPPITRSIGYARWVDAALTWPLLLLMLCLVTGFSLSRVFMVLFFGLLTVIWLLVGALTRTRYKWGDYTFAVISMFFVFFSLLHPGRRSAFRLGDDYGRAYVRSAAFGCMLWLIYPIIWAVSEGGNVITVTSECIAYGILDLLLKIVWLFSLLYAVEGLDYDRFGFSSGKYSDGAAYPATGVNAVNHTAASGAPGRPTMAQQQQQPAAAQPGSLPPRAAPAPPSPAAGRSVPSASAGGAGGQGTAPAAEAPNGASSLPRSGSGGSAGGGRVPVPAVGPTGGDAV